MKVKRELRDFAPGPRFYAWGALGVALLSFFLFLPSIVLYERAPKVQPDAFPVSVDPKNKIIVENALIDAQFSNPVTPLQAAVFGVSAVFSDLAAAVIETPVYQAMSPDKVHIVTIQPGYRKEQVAHSFGKVLGWNSDEEDSFIGLAENSNPVLTEGEFEPGTYLVHASTTPEEVRQMIHDQFNSDIESRYTSSTESVVPLQEALTIASMIERETNDKEQMRLISGIIWNRTFSNMRLQIDATVQYAKADGATTWWPIVHPADISIKSPYNTYRNTGLPPAPISNPSVAAVIAALNPKKTDCVFYFHDIHGGFHCSATYADHVKSLKEYYGRGR
jgi:hypothetical protein